MKLRNNQFERSEIKDKNETPINREASKLLESAVRPGILISVLSFM